MHLFKHFSYCLRLQDYHNVPKFLDKQLWANSVDPDQTAPRSSGQTV